VLDAYVFETIEQVREITEDWLSEYNEERLHDSLGRVAPLTFMPRPIAAREGQFLNPQHSKKVCVEELDVTPLDPSLNILCSLPKEAAGIPLMITTEFVSKVAIENLTLVLMQSARSELGWC
jgi:hypothetical protein